MKFSRELVVVAVLCLDAWLGWGAEIYNSEITFSPCCDTQVAMDLEFKFSCDSALALNDYITFRMPRFTTATAAGSWADGADITGLAVSPSRYWTADWQEGTLDLSDPFYYANLTFTLTLSTVAFAAGDQVTFTAHKSNDIKPFCGTAPDWAGFAMQVTAAAGDIPWTAVLDTTQLGKGCYPQLCNWQGECDYCYEHCACYQGHGSQTEDHIQPPDAIRIDCAHFTCPSGIDWSDRPAWDTSTTFTAHTTEVECSNNGVCDRQSGNCQCFTGYSGDACQRNACPNACSGRGRCMDLHELAATDDALPLSATDFTYGTVGSVYADTWDRNSYVGCVCDSGWAVGLGSGEMQVPEFYGPDCSLRRCASGDDPITTTTDETDCEGVTADGGHGVGLAGNLCYVPCSNRGLCEESTGLCTCFPGFYGETCQSMSTLAK